MRCPVCEQAAPRGANFCFACGTALARVCPTCQAGQAADARFCPECGTALSAAPGEATDAPREAVAPREAAAPPGIANDLLDDEALEAAIERTRRRESWRRVATLVGMVVLFLVILGGVALWLRTSPPALERSAGPPPPAATPPPVAPPPTAAPAAPEPAPSTAVPRSTSPPTAPSTAMPAPPATPRATPEPTLPQPVLPERSPASAIATAPPVARPSSPPTARRAPVEPETPAAMPQRARADVRVEVSTARIADGITSYTVRLRERDGAPVTGAAVAIRGRRKDGALVEAELDPTTEPGVYRAAVRAGEVREPRLRVASAGRIQDLPLAE